MRKGSLLKEVQGGKEGARRETRREKENGKNEEKVRKKQETLYLEYCGVLEAQHRENILVDE